MNLKILILPGDGIGLEVTRAATQVLNTVAKKFGHTLELSQGLLGGIAVENLGPEVRRRFEISVSQAFGGFLRGQVGLGLVYGALAAGVSVGRNDQFNIPIFADLLRPSLRRWLELVVVVLSFAFVGLLATIVDNINENIERETRR